MMYKEYLVCLSTFLLISILGMEVGMMLGVLLAMLSFVVAYSSVPAVKANTARMSSVRRTFEEQELLLKHGGQTVTISMTGYIFFGSALSILHDVKSNVVVPAGSGIDLSQLLIELGRGGEACPEDVVKAAAGQTDDIGDDVENVYKTCKQDEDDKEGDLIDDDIEPNPEESTAEQQSTKSRIWSATSWLWMNSPSQKRFPVDSNSSDATSSILLTPTEETRLTKRPSVNGRLPPLYDQSLAAPVANHARVRTSSAQSASSGSMVSSPNVIKSFYDLSSEQKNTISMQWAQARLKDMHRQPSFTSVLSSYIDVDSISLPERDASSKPAFLNGASATSLSTSVKVSKLADGANNNENGLKLGIAGLGRRRFTESQVDTSPHKGLNALLGSTSKSVDTSPDIPTPPLSASREGNGSDGDGVPSMFQSLWQAQQTNSSLANVVDKYHLRSKGALKSPLFTGRSSDTNCNNINLASQSSGTESAPVRKDRRSYSVNSVGSITNDVGDEHIVGSLSGASATGSDSGSGACGLDVEVFVDNEEFDHINGRPVTKYLVLDFEHVLGVDATAARTCFLMIVQLMRASNIYVVFTELSAQIEDLLRAHGVLRSDDIVIPKLDDALEWCEEQILCSVG
jgi:hypothetical protein